jgi:hypothetical protein
MRRVALKVSDFEVVRGSVVVMDGKRCHSDVQTMTNVL